MRILDRGDGWVALLKPAGYHVHPPEDARMRVPRDRVMLYLARDFLGRYVYPVHRLDAPTTGVLLMALDPRTAGALAASFRERDVEKTYHAVVRGWAPEAAVVDLPLELDSTGDLADSVSEYRRLAKIEIPEPVGRRHPTARYSLLEIRPRTGRYHQIRRHMNRISHPILGDCEHGDSRHNRFFRERLKLAGLCLKAHALEFTDPSGARRKIEAPDDEKWTEIRRLFSE